MWTFVKISRQEVQTEKAALKGLRRVWEAKGV